MLNKWKHNLAMLDWTITTEPILDSQVIYPDDLLVKDFVGIVYSNMYGTIYHSRPLTEEDIVHELLHAKNPDRSEKWVVAETERMLNYFVK